MQQDSLALANLCAFPTRLRDSPAALAREASASNRMAFQVPTRLRAEAWRELGSLEINGVPKIKDMKLLQQNQQTMKKSISYVLIFIIKAWSPGLDTALAARLKIPQQNQPYTNELEFRLRS